MLRCMCRNVGTPKKMPRSGPAERDLELALAVAGFLLLAVGKAAPWVVVLALAGAGMFLAVTHNL